MINQKLQLFLEKELLTRWGRKIIFTPDMKLYENFGITGDDAGDFIIRFTEEFNISLDKDFRLDERFPSESDSTFNPIQAVINWSKNQNTTVPKDLSISELQEAIHTGILK